jgi:hypothetical protein
MKRFIYLLALIFLPVGCAPSPVSTVGSNCETLQPTPGDVQYILNFGSELFTEAVWQRSYSVYEQETIVSWTHRSVASLADISMQLFCSDNGTADLELYYNAETLTEKFSNYDSTNIVASCKNEELVLYEIDAVAEGVNYVIHQWLQPLNQTRLLSVVTVFPKEETVLIEKYSQTLFPTLPTCP